MRDYAPWRILYFVSFLLIGGFLVLNMIVGVVVENFQRCREMQGDEEKAKKALDKWRVAAGKATSNGKQRDLYRPIFDVVTTLKQAGCSIKAICQEL